MKNGIFYFLFFIFCSILLGNCKYTTNYSNSTSGKYSASTVTKQNIIITFDSKNVINKIEDFYISTNEKSNVTIANYNWSETPCSINSENKYLWNYQRFTFSDNTVSNSAPQIIAEFNSEKGNVKNVFSYFFTTDNNKTNNTWEENYKTLSNYKTDVRYDVWNYKKITYQDVSFDDDILYYSYNGIVQNVEKIYPETEGYTDIQLFGGDSSFAGFEYRLDTTAYIETVSITFTDSLSEPINNCLFTIIGFSSADNSNYFKIYDYQNDGFLNFAGGQTFLVNKYIDRIRFFFSSNNSSKGKRNVKVSNIKIN